MDELQVSELKVSGTFSSRIGAYGVLAGAKEREDATEVLSSLAQRVCFLGNSVGIPKTPYFFRSQIEYGVPIQCNLRTKGCGSWAEPRWKTAHRRIPTEGVST